MKRLIASLLLAFSLISTSFASETVNVLSAGVYHTGFKVGKANINLRASENGELENLSLNTHIKINARPFIYVDEAINESVTYQDFENGEPIKFGLKKASQSLLIIEPGSDITPNGGSSILKIRSKNGYVREAVVLAKGSDGNFAFYLGSKEGKNRIVALKIHVGGMLPEVFIKKYSVETEKSL